MGKRRASAFPKNFSFSCNQSGTVSSSTSTNCNTMTSQSNNTTISTNVSNFQQTGNNEANINTQGNVAVVNGNVSSTTTATTTANTSILNTMKDMHEMMRRVNISIQDNGVPSGNAITISSH